MMISVDEARRILFNNIPKPTIQSVDIAKSVGFVLAEDLFSPIGVPQFDNSAMDGYAFSFSDFQQRRSIRITQIIQAGSTSQVEFKPGEAARIFTGAPVPTGLDTMVMQELVEVKDGKLMFLTDNIQQGDHIRKSSSQTAKGDQVAKSGMRISPALIGFLAGLGIAEVKIFSPPRVMIVTSGKELVPPGKPLSLGQIYESSSFALYSALSELEISPQKLPIVDDNREKILETLRFAMVETDILLITGGISVGDYDFVHDVLRELGVEELIYKIRQKPGKPLFVGKKENLLVFGLPGNPASTLSCFYQYVKPVVQLLMGKMDEMSKPLLLPLLEPFRKKEGLTQFAKGLITDDGVKILNDQESFKMNSFAMSDCQIELDEELDLVPQGHLVKVHRLR